MRTLTWVSLAIVAALASIPPTLAQQALAQASGSAPTIKRTPLQRFDVPATTYETIIGIAEMAPNAPIGRHTHPGPESGYVIEGGFELLVEGLAPRLLKPGDSYQIPAGTTHDAKAGAGGAKVIATYVVLKGQPLASPVGD